MLLAEAGYLQQRTPFKAFFCAVLSIVVSQVHVVSDWLQSTSLSKPEHAIEAVRPFPHP